MDITTYVQGLTGPAVYAAIGGFAFAESAAFLGLLVPGETAMLLGGALAGLGQVSLPVMILAAITGAVLGDLAGYGLGRRFGPALRHSRMGRRVGDPAWTRAEDLVRRRGPLAIFLGRWVGMLRALVPAVAGVTRMPLGRFLTWNVLGGASWATTVLVLGYVAGSSWSTAQGWLGTWAVVTGTVTTLIAVAVVLRARRRRTRGPDPLDVTGQPRLVTSGVVS